MFLGKGQDMVCLNCGTEFWSMMARKFCNSKCRKAYWGKTAVGKAAAARGNAKKKRPDIIKTCELCRGEFTTARKLQILCGECSKSPEGRALVVRRYAERNAMKTSIRLSTANIRAIHRRRGIGMPCVVCSSLENGELHHPHYGIPSKAVPYCRDCHKQLHKFENAMIRKCGTFN